MLTCCPYCLTAHAALLLMLPCCPFLLAAHAIFLPCCLMECCPFFLTANAAHAAYSTLLLLLHCSPSCLAAQAASLPKLPRCPYYPAANSDLLPYWRLPIQPYCQCCPWCIWPCCLMEWYLSNLTANAAHSEYSLVAYTALLSHY
jgi:hypothetical protein